MALEGTPFSLVELWFRTLESLMGVDVLLLTAIARHSLMAWYPVFDRFLIHGVQERLLQGYTITMHT